MFLVDGSKNQGAQLRTSSRTIPKVLTVAGSDSGGCAGIQADLKTFGALGVHGMSVITSVTAQDTRRVYLTSKLPLENIKHQFEVVVNDLGVDALKTGMLVSAEIIALVADRVKHFGIDQLVVDPVMNSTGGDPMIEPEAVEMLKSRLFPQALVVTPNLGEAELLTGQRIDSEKKIREVARTIFELGPRSVLLKGGHPQHTEYCTDYFFDGVDFLKFSAPRVNTKNTHGSGCTLAAAISAYLALGLDLKTSINQAKEYVTCAIHHSLELGHGNGPLNHFWKSWID